MMSNALAGRYKETGNKGENSSLRHCYSKKSAITFVLTVTASWF